MKDVFVLRKKSFWTWMMKFIWDFTPEHFSHMCPFFWLSIFNLIIIIPVAIYRVIAFLIKKASDALFNHENNKSYIKENRYEIFDKLMRDPVKREEFIERVARYKAKLTDCLSYYDNHMYYLASSSDDTFDPIYERTKVIQVKYAAEIEAKKTNTQTLLDLEYQQRINHKKRVTNILKIVQPVAKVLLYLLGLATIFFLGLGIYKLVLFFKYATIDLKVLRAFLNALLFIAVSIFSILIIIGVVKKLCNTTLSCENKKKWGSIISSVLTVILYIPFMIIKGVLFLVDTLKDNCPAVKWKD